MVYDFLICTRGKTLPSKSLLEFISVRKFQTHLLSTISRRNFLWHSDCWQSPVIADWNSCSWTSQLLRTFCICFFNRDFTTACKLFLSPCSEISRCCFNSFCEDSSSCFSSCFNLVMKSSTVPLDLVKIPFANPPAPVLHLASIPFDHP